MYLRMDVNILPHIECKSPQHLCFRCGIVGVPMAPVKLTFHLSTRMTYMLTSANIFHFGFITLFSSFFYGIYTAHTHTDSQSYNENDVYEASALYVAM